jgi:hypothetical protein
MSELWRDVRFGVRLLCRSPVFVLAVALLLGIGIGANTLIFSFVDALLLRPLPVRHAERLVRLVEVHPTGFVTWELPYEVCEHFAENASLRSRKAHRRNAFGLMLSLEISFPRWVSTRTWDVFSCRRTTMPPCSVTISGSGCWSAATHGVRQCGLPAAGSLGGALAGDGRAARIGS